MFNRFSSAAMLRSRRFSDDIEIKYTPDEVPRKPKFEEFDIASIADDTVIAVIGRRNSGKSTLVKDIIQSRYSHITEGIVCSGSEKSNPFYRMFMAPSIAFCQSLNEEHLTGFISNAKLTPKTPKIVVLDDLAFSNAQKNSRALKEIIFNGRHFGCTVILVSQTAVDLGSPSVRGNVDIVFLTRENLIPAIEAAYKFFFSVFPTLREFKTLVDENKKHPYRTIVANMASFGGITDMIKVYTAKFQNR